MFQVHDTFRKKWISAISDNLRSTALCSILFNLLTMSASPLPCEYILIEHLQCIRNLSRLLGEYAKRCDQILTILVRGMPLLHAGEPIGRPVFLDKNSR